MCECVPTGVISRQEAEDLLEEEKVGSFLVRVSERIWGYAISYRGAERCKHFLIDTSDGSYQFFGTNQIAHSTLAELVDFHKVRWSLVVFLFKSRLSTWLKGCNHTHT